MSSSLRYILSATAALALASVTQADTVISFNATAGYVATNQQVANVITGGGTANPTVTVAFSLGSPIRPSNSTYTGPDIYGGGINFTAGRTTAVAGTSSSPLIVFNSTPDVLRFSNAFSSDTGTAGESATNRAIALFASSNTALGFGANSSISLTAARANTNGTAAARLAVVSGGDVYLSQSTISLNTSNNLTSHVFTGLAGETFGLWTPTSDFNISAVNYNVLGSALSGIQFAGVYYEATSTNIATSNFNMSAFSLEATTIPEPSTYAALLGLGAISIVAYRRFKSKKA